MLIIDGNAVFEVDCDCARKQGLFAGQMSQEGTVDEERAKADTGAQYVKKEVYTGKQVTVAVLDTGLYPHPDFSGRIVGWYDAVAHKKEPYDLNGHGTQEGVTPVWRRRARSPGKFRSAGSPSLPEKGLIFQRE